MPRTTRSTAPKTCKLVRILGENVRPGEVVSLDMQVAKLYTRTQVDIPVVVHRAKREGPSILIMAAVHGDEVGGIEIVRRILEQLKSRPLDRGTLIAIPVLNVFGFIAMQREMPDGRDLNRFFPGSLNGSLASRLAYALVNEVLPAADVVIDLHAGGAQRLNHPQLRYTEGDQQALDLAHMFDPPVILRSKKIVGSLRQHMSTTGTPYLLFESGASRQFDPLTTSEGERGITRILTGMGLWSGKLEAPRGAAELTASKWVRAAHSGLLEPMVRNGTAVAKGDILAYINDPYGTFSHDVRATFEGRVLCVNTSPVVNQGDGIFHLGKA